MKKRYAAILAIAALAVPVGSRRRTGGDDSPQGCNPRRVGHGQVRSRTARHRPSFAASAARGRHHLDGRRRDDRRRRDRARHRRELRRVHRADALSVIAAQATEYFLVEVRGDPARAAGLLARSGIQNLVQRCPSDTDRPPQRRRRGERGASVRAALEGEPFTVEDEARQEHPP